jgi:hypothetical protein
MAHPVRRGRSSAIAAAAAAAVAVGGFVLIPLLGPHSGHDRDADADRDHGDSVAEFIKDHPQYRNHRTAALAYLSEKLSESGGEASEEILNGPAQEEYAERAYPRSVIGNTQIVRSRSAYSAALDRAGTSAGRQAQAKAVHASSPRDWQPIGPDGGSVPGATTYTGTPSVVSGRATALAFGAGSCTARHCLLFAGTAGGGVWKTTDALAKTPRWTSIGAGIPSTAIGSLLVTADGTLYVGTGEANGSSDSEAGRGLYRSTNDGASFGKVSTVADSIDFTLNRSIASIVVDPHNSKHLLVGTAVARHGASSVNGGRFTPPGAATLGLYESTDGGKSWHLTLSKPGDTVDPGSATGDDYFRGDVTKVAFDPTDPSTVYASVSSYGLYRRVGNGAWKRIYAVPGNAADLSLYSRVEFATAALPNGHTRIYLGDATLYGDADSGYVSGLLRTDDARTGTPSWKTLSDKAKGTPGYGSYNFCQTQCTYDMVVSSPPGQPNTVYLSGSMNYDEVFVANQPSNGRAVVRSTDAGRNFTDMTDDAATKPNGLHPDQHALAFVPGSRNGAFVVGDDGGLNRESGPYVDASADCDGRGLTGADLTDCKSWLSAVPTSNTEINDGLQTLQYQSVTLTPDGDVVQGGTQDNGTWESDGAGGWTESVGGDGGQSGFDAADPNIRYHAYYNPQYDVNFNGSDPYGWDWIADPLQDSGETASFYTPLAADPVTAGTVYVGLQHIWRTTDHGGDPDYLQQYCNELTGDYDPTVHPCGDWQPLGGDAGDLSGTSWGSDTDSGNYVVAVERPATNKNTMWAATRYGRLFVSGNADAANPDDVTYTRLDTTLGLPQRFISSISVDPANPYHVWVSYSGYSAYSPGGHVYEVTYDPTTGHATAKDLSHNLGDQPVTAVRYSPTTGTLFAATDYGVLTLPRGGTNWVATAGLPQVAVYGLTLDSKGRYLYAATHGRSIWKLKIS